MGLDKNIITDEGNPLTMMGQGMSTLLDGRSQIPTNTGLQGLQALINSVVSPSKEPLISDMLVFAGFNKNHLQPWVEAVNISAYMKGKSCLDLSYCKSSGPFTAPVVSNQVIG